MKKGNGLRFHLVRAVGVAVISFATFIFTDQYLVPAMSSKEIAKREYLIESSRKLRKNPTIKNALFLHEASEDYLGAMYLASFECSRFQRKVLWQNNFLNNPNSVIKSLRKVDNDEYPRLLKVMEQSIRERSELSQMVKENPYDAQVHARMVGFWGQGINKYIDARKRN